MNFLLTELKGEAERHLESQIDSYSDYLLKSCNAALSNAAQKDSEKSENARKAMDDINSITKQYEKNKDEISKKIAAYRAQFKLDFSDFIDRLKSSLRQEIMSANLATLKNTDDIAVKTKQQIVSFVDGKINDINSKLNADITASQTSIREYLSGLSLPIEVKAKEYSQYSSLFLPATVAGSYFFFGFFSLSFIGVLIAAIVGRNFFEGAISRFLSQFGINSVREKLIEEIFPKLDKAKDNLESKFDESFDQMEKEILASYDAACANALAPLKIAANTDASAVSDVKACRDKLETLVNNN